MDSAALTEPLRMVARADGIFHWGELQTETFERIKQELEKVVELSYYSKTDRTYTFADAVLSQMNEKNEPRIITYASRTINKYERKLSQTEKEAIALVWSEERFYLYLYGRHFYLVTDHKPLEVIFGPRHKASMRLERLQIRLQAYVFTIIHVPGKQMVADVFSRLCGNAKEEPISEIEVFLLHAEPKNTFFCCFL